MAYLSNEIIPNLKSKISGSMPQAYETYALLEAAAPAAFEIGTLGIVCADESHDGKATIYKIVEITTGGSYDQTDNLLVNQTYLAGFKTEDDYFGSWKGDAATATWNGTTSDSRGFYSNVARYDLLSGFDPAAKDYSLQFQALDTESPATVLIATSSSSTAPSYTMPTDGTNINLPKGDWSALGLLNISRTTDLMWKVPGQVPCNFNIRLYEGLDHPAPQITGGTTVKSWQYIGTVDSFPKVNNLPDVVLTTLPLKATANEAYVTIYANGQDLTTGRKTYPTCEIPMATEYQSGVIPAAMYSKLSNMANIKTIGDGLSLSEDGVLTAAGGAFTEMEVTRVKNLPVAVVTGFEATTYNTGDITMHLDTKDLATGGVSVQELVLNAAAPQTIDATGSAGIMSVAQATKLNRIPDTVVADMAASPIHEASSVKLSLTEKNLTDGTETYPFVTISAATATQAGVMTTAQVAKLAELEAAIGDINTLLEKLNTGAGV